MTNLTHILEKACFATAEDRIETERRIVEAINDKIEFAAVLFQGCAERLPKGTTIEEGYYIYGKESTYISAAEHLRDMKVFK